MAHPWYHAVLAARRYGGTPEDYLEVETWMDFTKSHTPDCRHRLLLHNAWGVFLAERILGATLTRASDGKILPLRPLLEDHITQDFGRIPTLAACFAQLAPESLDPRCDGLRSLPRLSQGVWRRMERLPGATPVPRLAARLPPRWALPSRAAQ